MKRTHWIFLDLALATIVAILGNIVASFLQERFDLTDPIRFVLVAILFVLCLVLLLFVTLRKSRDETSSQNGDIGSGAAHVQQEIKDVEKGGQVTGIEAEELGASATATVKQEARKVAGQMTGMRVGRMGERSAGEEDK